MRARYDKPHIGDSVSVDLTNLDFLLLYYLLRWEDAY